MKLPRMLAIPLDLMPLPVIGCAAHVLFRTILAQHRGLFERLGEHGGKRFAFVPSELPLVFTVQPEQETISVTRRRSSGETADACVEGPFFMLLALLEGRCDADALFFSRDLAVTGDMEAMLAMRNALDDAGVDLPRDLSGLAGPLGMVVRKTAEEFRRRALAVEVASWN